MKIVLFLGAGFAARFGLPVMNDFLAFVHSSKALKDEDKNFIGRLVIETRQANSFLRSSPVNLEDMLTFAMMGDRLGLSSKDGSKRGDRMRRILKRVYTEIREPFTFWANLDDFKTFLNVDLNGREHELSVVTTNYDLMIECAFHRMGLRMNPVAPYESISDQGPPAQANFYSIDGTELLKLHGSVNWYEPPDGQKRFDVDERLIRKTYRLPEGPQEIPMPAAFDAADSEQRPPAVVPPSFIKPEMSGPLTVVWEKAATALRSARRIIFVGYSFPPSDTEMKYFLARSLVENAELECITIVDPNADQILARLRNASSGYGTHFQDFLKGEASRWSDSRLNWS